MVPDFLTLSGSESWLQSWEKVQLSISIMSLSLGLMWMVYSSSSQTHMGIVLCLQTYSRLALCSLFFKCMLHLDLLFMVHFTYVRFLFFVLLPACETDFARSSSPHLTISELVIATASPPSACLLSLTIVCLPFSTLHPESPLARCLLSHHGYIPLCYVIMLGS